MKYLLSLLAILLNIGIASAQIEVTDSTSTDWGGGTDVDVTPGKPTGKVTSLSLSQNRLLLSGGQTAQLVAVINADAANKSVTWSVADNTIATVSANGLVTAITAGQTVATATSVDGGLTAQCLVTVKNNAKVYVERITLDITEMEMYVGEVRAVTPTVYPDNATDKTLKWETRGVDYYNPALPDENHVFTAYKPGVIEMKIYPNDGSEAYAVCKITVKDRPLTKMTLPSEIVLNINEMKTLKPEVTPELFQKKYKWTVADPSVAYVTSSGRITGVKAGTTTVTATALDGTGVSATSKVTVTSTVASLGYSGWILERGEDIQPWTALCFHEAGYYEKPAPDDSKGNKWYSPDYDDSSWYYAYGPLKHRVWPGGGERRTGYGQWEILDYSTMSIRQKFYLPDVSGYDFKVYARVYLSGEVYINGHRVYITDTGDHHRTGSFMAFIDPSYLVMGGENTIAIIGYPCGEEQYLDFGIHYERSIPVTRLLFRQKQLTMSEASSSKLEAILKPAEATHQSLTWSSSDESVAVVHQDGTVVSLKPGTAVITATTTDGSNLSAQCPVTVTDSWGEEKEVTVFPYCRKVLAFHQSRDKGFLTDENGRSFSELGYDETGWEKYRMPFATKNSNPGFTLVEETNQRYFVRQHFSVPDIRGKYVVRVHCSYRGYLRIYCNGTQIGEGGVVWIEYGYEYYDIPADLIRYGEDNVIAISIDNSDYVHFDNMITLLKIVPVMSVTMSETSLSIDLGEQKQLTVTVLPENAYNRQVKWASSEPTIALVDQNGNVTGMGEGKATITATSVDGTGIVASCEVTVSDEIAPVKDGEWIVTFDEPWTAQTLYATEADMLYEQEPATDAEGHSWTSVDYDDSTWTTITVPMYKNDGFFPDDNCRYYVRSKFFVGDLSEVNSLRFCINHDDEATVYINGIMVADYSWCSYNECDLPLGIFRNGENVIAVNVHQGSGDAYLSFGLKGSSEYAEEIVKAESIAFEHQEETVDVGKRLLLPVIFSPYNTTFRNLEWTSSNESVATVSSDGYVKGEAVGEAVITATTMDGSGLSASCRIYVVQSETVLDWGANTPWTSKFVYAAEANKYDYNDPQSDAEGREWTALDYDDSEWGTLTGPMGMDVWYAPYNYTWSGDYNRHWLRRKFTLNESPEGKTFRFECMHDDDIQVFLNGELVVDDENWTDETHVQFDIPSSAFREGDNILAIRLYQGCGGAYLDYEITSTKGLIGSVESLVVTAPKSNAFYDLTGRKVTKPQRGIYIYGGKKVIIE